MKPSRSTIGALLTLVAALAVGGLVPEARAHRILYLGDSLSMGAFGRTVDADLRAAGHEVYTYVTGGATPYYWLSAYAPINCTIGHWEKTPVSDDRYKYVKAVPKLEALLERHDPDLVVVQTGVNLYSTLRSKRRSPDENRREVSRLLENMCRTITAGGRACYWISPPDSHPGRFPRELQSEMLTITRQVVEKHGVLFDSGRVTRFTDPYPETDGIHYGPTEARVWASKVTADLVPWAAKLDIKPRRRGPLLLASSGPLTGATAAAIRKVTPRTPPSPTSRRPKLPKPTAAVAAPPYSAPAIASSEPTPAPTPAGRIESPTGVNVPPPPPPVEEIPDENPIPPTLASLGADEPRRAARDPEIPMAIPVDARIPLPLPASLVEDAEVPRPVPVPRATPVSHDEDATALAMDPAPAPVVPDELEATEAPPAPAPTVPEVFIVRKAVPQEDAPSEEVVVDIVLRRMSVVPHLSDVPYDKAFAIYEWEVLQVESGKYPHSVIRIAHPVVWGGRMTSAAEFEIGKEWSLKLAFLSRYPSLEQLQIFDDLDLRPELPIYTAKL